MLTHDVALGGSAWGEDHAVDEFGFLDDVRVEPVDVSRYFASRQHLPKRQPVVHLPERRENIARPRERRAASRQRARAPSGDDDHLPRTDLDTSRAAA